MSKPQADFNACDDFFVLIIECLAAMNVHSLFDTPVDSVLPNAQNVWMLTYEERKIILASICDRIISTLCSLNFRKHQPQLMMAFTTMQLHLYKCRLFLHELCRCHKGVRWRASITVLKISSSNLQRSRVHQLLTSGSEYVVPTRL